MPLLPNSPPRSGDNYKELHFSGTERGPLSEMCSAILALRTIVSLRHAVTNDCWSTGKKGGDYTFWVIELVDHG